MARLRRDFNDVGALREKERATWTALLTASEDSDIENAHSLAESQVMPKTAGTYLVIGCADFTGSSAGNPRGVRLHFNGTSTSIEVLHAPMPAGSTRRCR